MVSSLILFCSFALCQEDLAMAHADYSGGHFEQAIEKLNAKGRNELSPGAYMLRADCLHKLGKFSEALNDYDRAKLHGYANPDLLLNRGICRSSAGAYDTAKLDIVAYLEYDREDPKAYYWLAHIEYLMMENNAALRYVDEAVALDSLYEEAYFLRGAIFADQRKILLAMEDFKTAYLINPKLHRAKFHFATLTMDLGLNEQAKEILSELLLEETDFSDEIFYYRGWCSYTLHDSDGACNDWVESARLGNHDSEESHRKGCLDKGGMPRIKRRSYARF